MHHGKFTTAREAVAAHNGEALTQRKAFDALPAELQNDVIEFLKEKGGTSTAAGATPDAVKTP